MTEPITLYEGRGEAADEDSFLRAGYVPASRLAEVERELQVARDTDQGKEDALSELRTQLAEANRKLETAELRESTALLQLARLVSRVTAYELRKTDPIFANMLAERDKSADLIRRETAEPEAVAPTVEQPQPPGGLGPVDAFRAELVEALREADMWTNEQGFRRVADRLETKR